MTITQVGNGRDKIRTTDRNRNLLILLTSVSVTAVLATWPLAANFTRSCPLGTVGVPALPQFLVWQLWWVAQSVTQCFRGFWHAPIFHPHPMTTSYSEPQILAGILVSPLWSIDPAPALVLNCAIFFTLLLNGLFAYRFVRALRVEPAVATIVSSIVTAMPLVAIEGSPMNTYAIYGPLAVYAGIIQFRERPSIARASWIGFALIVSYLSSQFHLLFAVPGFAVATAIACVGPPGNTFRLIRFSIPVLVACAIVFMFAWKPLHFYHSLEIKREIAMVQTLSPRAMELIFRPKTAVFPPRVSATYQYGLLPGFLLYCLALFGVWTETREKTSNRRIWAVFLAAIGFLSLSLSLGTNLAVFGDWRPVMWLHDNIPGFGQVRSYHRFIGQVEIAIVGLASMALDRLARAGKTWTRGFVRRKQLVLMIGILILIERLAIPMPLTVMPTWSNSAWVHWLADKDSKAAIVHIPAIKSESAADQVPITNRMLFQVIHHHPIVDGYSGMSAPGSLELNSMLVNEFPSLRSLCVLYREIGARFAVIDIEWALRHSALLAARSDALELAFIDNEVRIYRLRLPAGGCYEKRMMPWLKRAERWR